MNIWIILTVTVVTFSIFYALGLLTAKWLHEYKPPCRHHWTVLLEKYPTFTYDWWKCSTCGLTQKFPYDKPPVPFETEICSMGHVHIAKITEQDEWPDTISTTTNQTG